MIPRRFNDFYEFRYNPNLDASTHFRCRALARIAAVRVQFGKSDGKALATAFHSMTARKNHLVAATSCLAYRQDARFCSRHRGRGTNAVWFNEKQKTYKSAFAGCTRTPSCSLHDFSQLDHATTAHLLQPTMPSKYIVEVRYDSPKPKPTIKASFKSSSGDGWSSSCEKWNTKHTSSSTSKQTEAMQGLMKTAKTKLEGKGHGVSAMKAVGNNMRAKTSTDGKERYWVLKEKKSGKVVMRGE